MIDFVPILNPDRVEREQFFEGAGLGPALAAFEVAECCFGDSGELDHLGLRQAGAAPQRLQLGTGVLLQHETTLAQNQNIAPNSIGLAAGSWLYRRVRLPPTGRGDCVRQFAVQRIEFS